MFFVGVSLFVTTGFLLNYGRLFVKGHRKKLSEMVDKDRSKEKVYKTCQSKHFKRSSPFISVVRSLLRRSSPVIASIHEGCIGGGIGIITACDIMVCTEDAFFSVKEVDLALAADLGSLQSLPSIVGVCVFK